MEELTGKELILGAEVASLQVDLEVTRSALEAARSRVKYLEAAIGRISDIARSRLPSDALGLVGERFLENKLDRIAGIARVALEREIIGEEVTSRRGLQNGDGSV